MNEIKNTFDIKDIKRRHDGTFEVKYNGHPYHATKNDTPEVYQAVIDLIESGSPVVDIPPPAKPTAAELAEIRIMEIQQSLSEIDQKRIRPLAEGDTEIIEKLNQQARDLRQEMQTIRLELAEQ